MSDLLPVLVADLANDAARDFLEEVAQGGGEAWVPLLGAPADASRHLLEVYTPGCEEPLRLLAECVGPPGDHGFPLRLAPLDATARRGIEEKANNKRASEHPSAGVEVESLERDEETWTASKPPVERPERRDTPTATDLRKPAGPARRDVPVVMSSRHAADLGAAPDPTDGSLLGRKLADGKLEIQTLIGEGMMGAVYRAVHRELRIPVAVKVMHENFQKDVDFCRRFYAEALAVSRLDHTNLVRVYDFGQESDGLLYLAMEFLDGRSLREIVMKETPLSALRIAEIVSQICGGLGHAHARGIVHRDVKPDNVILLASQDDDARPIEHVKVCDFGLALLRSKDALRERFAGTPVYMSPEQCLGEELDARTDVYACGVLLFELATGAVPFFSEDPADVVAAHISTTPPAMSSVVPDVDPRLERIVDKALKKKREQRFADMRELRAALKEIIKAASGDAPAREARFDLATESARVAERVPASERGSHSIPAPQAAPSMPPMPSMSLPPAEEPAPMSVRDAAAAELSRADTMSRADLVVENVAKDESFTRAQTMPRLEEMPRPKPARSSSPALSPPSRPPLETFDADAVAFAAQPRASAAPSVPSFEEPPPSQRTPHASDPGGGQPSWLEGKDEGYQRFLSQVTAAQAQAVSKTSEDLADTLSKEPTPWLRNLLKEREPRALQRMLADLEIALRILAKRADAKALWAASSALHGMASDDPRAQGSRGQRAGMVLRLFNDPGMLGPITERMLARDDDARDPAGRLLVRAGVAGAYALYGARVKLAAEQKVRAVFIQTMRDIGETTWPVVRAALERIPETALTGQHRLAADLALDLLLCVPQVRDEAAGHVVGKYVRARDPLLCRAATIALGRLWADRARPVFLGLLADPDDGVRVAAIAGLRQIGNIDEHVVRRVAQILENPAQVSQELRVAAVAVLEGSTQDARSISTPLLAHLVRDRAPDDLTCVAAARVLQKLVGNEARAVIGTRADRSPNPLKAHLLALIAAPTGVLVDD